jgi:hypothetical protein
MPDGVIETLALDAKDCPNPSKKGIAGPLIRCPFPPPLAPCIVMGGTGCRTLDWRPDVVARRQT